MAKQSSLQLTSPSITEGIIAYHDLAYVENGHERQKLDLYLPETGENRPLIIWIHGGAFRMGSKEGNEHDEGTCSTPVAEGKKRCSGKKKYHYRQPYPVHCSPGGQSTGKFVVK